MSYSAIVSRIRTQPFPNADRLLLGNCRGYQVVVGKDTQDNDLGLFFPADGQLSEEFCQIHDLIGYNDLATGEHRGGFFAANRRVRAQRFRGEKSDGFWVPLSYLDYAGDISSLNDGDELTEFNGHPICNKYETQATRAAKYGPVKTRKHNVMFKEHIETKQLRYYADKIPAGARISFTEKLHGTSGRTGNVKIELPLSKWAKLLNNITHSWFIKPKVEWGDLNGTRRTVLDDSLVDGFYKEAFRAKAYDQFKGKLHKGEVAYYEIVGWVNPDRPVMERHDATKLVDKKFVAKYGRTITYTYGQQPGECDVYVYRMTLVNEDGYEVEYPWEKVRARCKEMGVKHVPEISTSIYMPDMGDKSGEWLTELAKQLAYGESTVDASHIREGIVLRVEAPDGTTDWFKYKSFEFSLMEGIVKDNEAVVDIEEAA